MCEHTLAVAEYFELAAIALERCLVGLIKQPSSISPNLSGSVLMVSTLPNAERYSASISNGNSADESSRPHWGKFHTTDTHGSACGLGSVLDRWGDNGRLFSDLMQKADPLCLFRAF